MVGKTTAEKLLIKPGTRAWTSSPQLRALIGPLPDGASWTDGADDATTAVVFADDERSLRSLLEEHREAVARSAYVWIAYPKGGASDINRDSLWPIVTEATGMRPITQIALDDTWSALRFRPLKPGEPPFAPRR